MKSEVKLTPSGFASNHLPSWLGIDYLSKQIGSARFSAADNGRSPNFLTHKSFNSFSKMPVQCPIKIPSLPSDQFATMMYGVRGASFAMHNAIGLNWNRLYRPYHCSDCRPYLKSGQRGHKTFDGTATATGNHNGANRELVSDCGRIFGVIDGQTVPSPHFPTSIFLPLASWPFFLSLPSHCFLPTAFRSGRFKRLVGKWR